MLAGLIHDSGRLVLNLLMPERYEPIMRAIYNREGESTAIELSALGFDHALAGRLVLQRWNFPEELSRAVEMHHGEVSQMEPLTLIVRAADELLWLLGCGVREATEPLQEAPAALSRLGYGLSDLAGLEERVRAAVESASESFGI